MGRPASKAGVRALGAALAAMLTVVLGACMGPGDQPVGELVGSWDQSEAWVEQAMTIDPVVLASDAEREQWLADVSGGAADDSSFEEFRAVDLEQNFLVIGGYTRCTEYSQVVLEDGDVRFVVTTDDEGTLCDWSPYTIDAWSVPLSETDGQVPQMRQ